MPLFIIYIRSPNCLRLPCMKIVRMRLEKYMTYIEEISRTELWVRS